MPGACGLAWSATPAACAGLSAAPCCLLAGVAANGLPVSRLAGCVYFSKEAGAGVAAGVAATAPALVAVAAAAAAAADVADGAAAGVCVFDAAAIAGVAMGAGVGGTSWEEAVCGRLLAAAVRGVSGMAWGA